MSLLVEEVRRILARRVVWVLVGLALAGVVLIGTVAYLNSGPEGLHYEQLWPRDRRSDAGLLPAITLLVVGGVIGGASIVGAEWRAGTVATFLLWEPRRSRVVVARLAAIASLAAVIAFVLEVILAIALLPAAMFRGSMEGVDGGWLLAATAAGARGAGVAGLAALLGGAIAFIGRHTAASLGAIATYVLIVESAVRGIWPWLTRWLVGSNAAVIIFGRVPPDAPFKRSVALGAATVAAYATVLVGAAVACTSVRDVPSS